MRIEFAYCIDGARKAKGLVIIIDVFRAFTTSCYVMNKNPLEYYLVGNPHACESLANTCNHPFLIGKNDRDSALAFDVPNSPFLVQNHNLTGRIIIHSSAGGGSGVINAWQADEILVGSFVNAAATVNYIKRKKPKLVTFVCTGNEGTIPSLEDELCAQYLQATLSGNSFDINSHLEELEHGSGRMFFNGMSQEYPKMDFSLCLTVDSFNFAIQAILHEYYASLNLVN